MSESKKKNGKTVAVLFGGVGAESQISERSCAAVLRALGKTSYLPYPVGIDKKGAFLHYTGSIRKIECGRWQSEKKYLAPTFPVRLCEKCGFLAPDGRTVTEVVAVLPILHGNFGEDGRIQGAVESAGIPLVGEDTLSSAVSADKFFTKSVASAIGIGTLPSFLLTEHDPENPDLPKAEEAAAAFGFPLFVKPARLGSSVGAAVAMTASDFRRLYPDTARVGGGRTLLEPFLPEKREIEVGFLAGKILSVGEVSCPAPFYGFSEKYGSLSQTKITPKADLPAALSERIRTDTLRLADALGIRDLSRFDWFLTPDGNLLFNEVNTLPGLTAGSLYPKMLGAAGSSLPDALGRLIAAAERRHTR